MARRPERTPPLDAALIAAVEGHRLEQVQALLAQGADPEARKADRRVLELVHPRRDDIRWALVEAGADPGRGGLLGAVRSGRPSLVAALLRRGASPDDEGDTFTTPLVEAIRLAHDEVARALLAAGADPTRAAPFGPTPLAAAAAAGRLEVVRALLEAGADPAARDREAWTPHGAAEAAGHVAVAALLRERGGVLPPDPTERLLEAARRGDLPGVTTALAAGADVDARERWDPTRGATPLVHAARAGHLDVVRALLAAGADPGRVDAVDAEGRRTVRMVFSHGGDEAVLASRLALGRCPLGWAAAGGHPQVARALLDAGASIGRTDLLERTPLHAAAGAGHLDVVRLLVERGADPAAKAHDGATPLTLATGEGRHDVATFLATCAPAPAERRKKIPARALTDAAAYADVALVRTLLAQGARPGKGALAAACGATRWEDQGDGSRTLVACSEDRVLEVVRALLEAGADVEAAGPLGTPLELARRHGHGRVVAALRAARRTKKAPRRPTRGSKRGR